MFHHLDRSGEISLLEPHALGNVGAWCVPTLLLARFALRERTGRTLHCGRDDGGAIDSIVQNHLAHPNN